MPFSPACLRASVSRNCAGRWLTLSDLSLLNLRRRRPTHAGRTTMFSADFRARSIAFQRRLDAEARKEVSEWLRGYDDRLFAEAVEWLFKSDFSLLAADQELSPEYRSLHRAVDELCAHAGA